MNMNDKFNNFMKARIPYFLKYLVNKEKLDSGEYWDEDFVFYINIANICKEYEQKFNSNLIKDINRIFGL